MISKLFGYFMAISLPVALVTSTFYPEVAAANASALSMFYAIYEVISWVLLIPLTFFTLGVILLNNTPESRWKITVKDKSNLTNALDLDKQYRGSVKGKISTFFSLLTPVEIYLIVTVLDDISFAIVMALFSIGALLLKANARAVAKKARALYEKEAAKAHVYH